MPANHFCHSGADNATCCLQRQSIEGQPEHPQIDSPPSGSFSRQQPTSPLSHRGEGLWPETSKPHAAQQRSSDGAHAPAGLASSMSASPFAAAAGAHPISQDGQLQHTGSSKAARRSSQDGGRGSLEGTSFKLKKAKQRKLAKQLHEAFAGTCAAC